MINVKDIYVDEFSSMEGKTITKTGLFDGGEKIYLIFSDGTFSFIKGVSYGEYCETEVVSYRSVELYLNMYRYSLAKTIGEYSNSFNSEEYIKQKELNKQKKQEELDKKKDDQEYKKFLELQKKFGK